MQSLGFVFFLAVLTSSQQGLLSLTSRCQNNSSGEIRERRLWRGSFPQAARYLPKTFVSIPEEGQQTRGSQEPFPLLSLQSHHNAVFKMARESQIKSKWLASRRNLCFLSPDVAVSHQDRRSFMEGQILLSVFPSFLASPLFTATFLLI